MAVLSPKKNKGSLESETMSLVRGGRKTWKRAVGGFARKVGFRGMRLG